MFYFGLSRPTSLSTSAITCPLPPPQKSTEYPKTYLHRDRGRAPGGRVGNLNLTAVTIRAQRGLSSGMSPALRPRPVPFGGPERNVCPSNRLQLVLSVCVCVVSFTHARLHSGMFTLSSSGLVPPLAGTKSSVPAGPRGPIGLARRSQTAAPHAAAGPDIKEPRRSRAREERRRRGARVPSTARCLSAHRTRARPTPSTNFPYGRLGATGRALLLF